MNFTKEEISLIAHTLGVDLHKSTTSLKKVDRVLREDFYRNRYQAESNEVFDGLVEKGLAKESSHLGLHFYSMTEKGEQAFRDWYEEIFVWEPKSRRTLKALKRRINYYCSTQNYYFQEDNSEHVFWTYLNYWIRGHRVSHTTEDVIRKFKTELGQYHKAGLLNEQNS